MAKKPYQNEKRNKYTPVYNAHPCFWSKLSGKESFILFFKFNYILILRYFFVL